MVIDILKFFSVYTLVCFAFACGMNQLLWYYADMERQVCNQQSKSQLNGIWAYNLHALSGKVNVSGPIFTWNGTRMFMPKSANEACIAYRKFSKYVLCPHAGHDLLMLRQRFACSFFSGCSIDLVFHLLCPIVYSMTGCLLRTGSSSRSLT